MRCDVSKCNWPSPFVGEAALRGGGIAVLSLCASHVEMESVLSWDVDTPVDEETLIRLSELRQAVEHDDLVWPWTQSHKDALVAAAKFVLKKHKPGGTG